MTKEEFVIGHFFDQPLKRVALVFCLTSLSLLNPILVEGQSPPLDPLIEPFPPSTYTDHHQIFSAACDSNGAMWFGTASSVQYFTGEDWLRIPTKPGMAVFNIEIGSKGRIWIGGSGDFGYLEVTEPKPLKSGELTDTSTSSGRDELKVGQLKFVSLLEEVPDSLKNFNIVWEVYAVPDSKRIIFRAKKYIFVWDGTDVRAITTPNSTSKSFRVGDEVWVKDYEHGLYRIPPPGELFGGKNGEVTGAEEIPEEYFLQGSEVFSPMNIMEVLEDVKGITREDEVLIVTRRNGLFRYKPDSPKKKGTVTPVGKSWRPFFREARVYGGLSLPYANPWGASMVLNTLTKGVMLIDSVGKPVLTLGSEKGMQADLIWETVHGPPGSGILWSATNKGVVRWNVGDPRTFDLEGKAFSGGVKCVRGCDDRLWLATSQGLYVRERPSSKRDKEIQNSVKRLGWKRIPRIKGQCKDLLCRDSSLLLAGQNNLLRIREKGDSWDIIALSRKNPYNLAGGVGKHQNLVASGGREGIVVLKEDANGKLQERLHISDLPEEVVTIEFGPVKTASSKIANDQVAIWVGFRTKGALRLLIPEDLLTPLEGDTLRRISFGDIQKEVSTSSSGIRAGLFSQDVLPEGSIRIFRVQGRLVIASDGGLHQPIVHGPEGSDVRFVSDTTFGNYFAGGIEEGKQGRRVFRIASSSEESESGLVWIQSGDPHRLIPRPDGSYRIDTVPFQGYEIDVRSIFPDTNGVTWLGGENGLMRYDSLIRKDFQRSYSCLLREVRAILPDPEDESIKKLDSVLFSGFYSKPSNDPLMDWKRAYEQPEAFVPTLPFTMNGLTFRFAAPFHELQEDVYYSYKLRGFEDRWSNWEKKTEKEYTNLSEGSYIFRVKARNGFGVESEVAEYRFTILPPWYRTWTAYGGYTVMGIGFIWFLIWLNSRRLVAQKRYLEQVVDERTSEIKEQKEKVEKKNEVITEQKKEVEKAHDELAISHKEITDSINYAQRIQGTILPPPDRLDSIIGGKKDEEHPWFILFKPQHIVSGDFYWAMESEGHSLWSAADCTGHGVPGAFVSLICSRSMTDAVVEGGLTDPGMILDRVRASVIDSMRVGEKGIQHKDGMDLALISRQNSKAEGKGVKVKFAGANNPLYIIRPESEEYPSGIDNLSDMNIKMYQGGEEVELKGDRLKPIRNSKGEEGEEPSAGLEIKGDPMAVSYEEERTESFTTVELIVQPGDLLFTFSDGFADQFGGPKGKKFKYKPFKKLLLSLKDLPMEEQKKELDQAFEHWKDELEQVDDVVVFGVKV